MDVHKNAPLTPAGREGMVLRVIEGRQTPQAVSEAVGVCLRTVRKWVKRFRAEGVAGLQDRSSRPHRLRQPTPATTVARIEALRRQRFTGKQIAKETGVSPATVSRVLKRLGIGRLRDLEPAEPVRRYERENPGELIHIDIKKLGRFTKIGHRITGDRTKQSNQRSIPVGGQAGNMSMSASMTRPVLPSAKSIPIKKAPSAVAFLKATVAYYASLGITVQRVVTDNGACHISKKFRKACADLGLKHIRTKPYTPRTNGKAERFIQTALREWAYATAFTHSDQRKAELPIWLHRYNWHRPHGSLNAQTPISRLALTGDNLLRLHS